MKKTALFLILAVMTSLVSFAQIQLVELDVSKLKAPPPLPAKSVQSDLAENPGLFADKIFEYNSLIELYDYIIKSTGVTHQVKIPKINYAELESPSTSVLKRFHAAADKLYNLIKSLPPTSISESVDKMIKDYNIVLKNQRRLMHENDSLKLEQVVTQEFVSRYNELLKDAITLRQILDTKSFEAYRELYKKTANDWRQIITLAGTANMYQFHDDFIETKVSPGVRIEMNPWRIFGFWFEYMNPILAYQPFSIQNDEKIYTFAKSDYKVNIYNVGVQLFANNIVTLPFMDNVGVGVKLGYGYYWGNFQMYNSAYAKTESDYHSLRGELNLSKHDFFIPLEMFAAYSFYFGADKIALNYGPGRDHTISSNNWGAFSLGLRFSIWRTP